MLGWIEKENYIKKQLFLIPKIYYDIKFQTFSPLMDKVMYAQIL